MREITVLSFVSLDGVAQGPVQPDEDTSDGFTQSGWTSNYIEEAMELVNTNLMEGPVSFLFGRKTFEMFCGHWPNSKTTEGDLFNQSQKYVVTTSLKSTVWDKSEIITGDPVVALKKLKSESGPRLQVHGSIALIQTLIANGLVDEFRLLTFPVIIGAGKRLFGSGTMPATFNISNSQVSSNGVVMGVYRRK